MESIAKQILNHLGNGHTKVERKQGFMGNYYSSLIDTIYIAEDFENIKMPNGAEKINKKAAQLIVVCHECIHSVQSKVLHILNTLFANFSLILSVIYVIIAVLSTSQLWFKILTISTVLFSVIFRLILEIGATNGSIKLAKEAVDKDLVQHVSNEDIQESIRHINKHKWFAFPQMVLDKIISLILLIII